MSEEAIVQKILGNEAYKKRDFGTAHKHYDAAISLSPNNCIFYSNKAAVFFHEGKFQECIDQCTKAIQIGRKAQADCSLISRAMARIGNAYLKLNNPHNAMYWYKESLTMYHDADVFDKLEKLEIKEKKHFPSDVFKWMKANANPKMALKLMKCCKYFCHPEFPYCVVKRITFSGMDSESWSYTTLDNKQHEEEKTDSIENVPKKLWITRSFMINPRTPDFLSKFISKIAVCDVYELSLGNQNLSFDEYQFLVSSINIKLLQICDTEISSDGVDVPIDELLGCVPNIKKFIFSYWFKPAKPFIKPGTFAKIIEKIKAVKRLSLAISSINSFADFELFLKFMDKNPHIRINFTFADCLSVEETKILQNYVDRIIGTGITKTNFMHKPPRLSFFGQSEESEEKLSELIFKHDVGIFLF